MRGRGKWRPQRGRGKRFSSANDPEAYIRGPRREDGEESSGSGSGSDGSAEDGTSSENSTSEGESEKSGGVDSESSFEESPNTVADDISKLSLTEKGPVPNEKKAPLPPSRPKELTRREREAIEKEQARQHFLKMKQKEDAARLLLIKKRREEEAAAHAAATKAKEEARLVRR